MMVTNKKQSVTGFDIITFQVKKSKDTEKLKLVLEADVDDIGAGNYNMGDVLAALQHHMTGDMEVGLSLFIQEVTESDSDEEEE